MIIFKMGFSFIAILIDEKLIIRTYFDYKKLIKKMRLLLIVVLNS